METTGSGRKKQKKATTLTLATHSEFARTISRKKSKAKEF